MGADLMQTVRKLAGLKNTSSLRHLYRGFSAPRQGVLSTCLDCLKSSPLPHKLACAAVMNSARRGELWPRAFADELELRRKLTKVASPLSAKPMTRPLRKPGYDCCDGDACATR